MRAHLHLRAATFLEILDQLFAGFELGPGRLIAIEIADETNPEADVVHVIAVNVAAADLFDPALADFDLAVPCRRAVADDEMVGESIFHPADVAMIVIENAGASLPGPAVVNDDEFPARALHRRAADRVDVRRGQITIIRRLTRPRPPTAFYRRRRWGRLVALFLFEPGFFHRDVGGQRRLRWNWPWAWSRRRSWDSRSVDRRRTRSFDRLFGTWSRRT